MTALVKDRLVRRHSFWIPPGSHDGGLGAAARREEEGPARFCARELLRVSVGLHDKQWQQETNNAEHCCIPSPERSRVLLAHCCVHKTADGDGLSATSLGMGKGSGFLGRPGSLGCPAESGRSPRR